MRSLAEEHGHKAIGIVLSGTANDGTLGLQEIKAAGGIAFAQDNTAEQASMPRSAIASGAVDFVLPPDEIARELGRISRHPFVGQLAADDPSIANAPALGRIFDILRHGSGVDFGNYKRNTLHGDHAPWCCTSSTTSGVLRLLRRTRRGRSALTGHPHRVTSSSAIRCLRDAEDGGVCEAHRGRNRNSRCG